MNITKSDIVDEVVERLGFGRKESVDIVEKLIEIIKQSLENGDDVLVSNFGKFTVKEKAERKGRDPATGKSVMLRERRVITFKTSNTLRNKINDKKYKYR